jgi:mRNA-degrading endonuclease RelE of RelBE toxin-antitoxin system
MSEDAAPERLAAIWSAEARSDLRQIDRELAMQILYCLDRDTKKLKPPYVGFRLRCGDYRMFFDQKDESTIRITGVRNRREAYR